MQRIHGMSVVILCAACIANDGAVGKTSSRLTTVDDLQAITPIRSTISYGPQAAYVPSTSFIGGETLDEQIVVSFEQSFWNDTPGDVLAPGWAVLSCPHDTLACPAGPIFTQTCSFDALPSTCNGTNAVPQIPNHQTWLGRSTIAAEPNARASGARNVVIATLVDTNGNVDDAENVALVVSNDGGQSFVHSVIANVEGDGCDRGSQDAPSVTFDTSKDPPIGYVAWRNRNGGSWGGCINAFIIDDNGNPNVFAPSHSITGMDKSHSGLNEGQGYLKAVAADGAVTVVYASDDTSTTCASGATLPTDMGWGAVTSFTDGSKWTDSGNTFVQTNNFVWCPGSLQRGFKEFDAAIGPDGNLYVVVTSDNTGVRLFMSPARGIVAHSGGEYNDLTWREYCPLGPPPFTTRWRPLITSSLCTAFPFQGDEIYHPSIGFDTNGRLLVSYYRDVDVGGSTNHQMFVRAVTTPRAALPGTSELQNEQSIAAPFTLHFEVGYGPYDPFIPFHDHYRHPANSLGWYTAVVGAGPQFPFPQGNKPFFVVFTTEDSGPQGEVLHVQSARVDFTTAQ